MIDIEYIFQFSLLLTSIAGNAKGYNGLDSGIQVGSTNHQNLPCQGNSITTMDVDQTMTVNGIFD